MATRCFGRARLAAASARPLDLSAQDLGGLAFGQLRQRENFWLSCLRCFGLSNNLRLHPPPRLRALANTRRLILDGLLSTSPGPAPTRFRELQHGPTWSGLVCACTHYLVFKEPTVGRRFRGRAPSSHSQGNLLMLRDPEDPVNHFLAGRHFPRRRPQNQSRFGEPCESINPDFPCQLLFRSVRRKCSRTEIPGRASGGDSKCSDRAGSIRPPFWRWVASEAER